MKSYAHARAQRAWISGLVLALVLVLGASARAQDAAPEAGSALRSALQAYEAGDLSAAQRGFAQAHREQPTARTLRGLGVVAYRQGRWLDAYAHLTLSLVSTAKPLTEELRARVLTLVDELGAKLTRVHFQLSPSDATLRVDGSPPSYDASGAVLILPGTHRVTLEAPNHVASVWVLEAEVGSEQLRSWQLALEGAAPPASALASTPMSATAPPPSDAPARLPEAASRPATLRRWGYGSLAVGLAGLAVMSASLGLGLDRLDEIEGFCRAQPGRQCTQAMADDAFRDARLDLLSLLTISGAVLTGVGAVAGTSLFLTARRAELARSPRAAGVFAGVRGAF